MLRYVFILLTLPLFGKGIVYSHFQDGHISAHVLEIDPSKYRIDLIKCDPIETPSEVAKFHDAIGAVNGGFTKNRAYIGEPAGIFQIDGKRFTNTDRSRGAIGWKKNGKKALIDRLDTGKNHKVIPFFHPENAKQWNKMDNILGSTPVLVSDFIIPNFFEERVSVPFVVNHYPRTAVGLKDDGTWVFVMVEGSRCGSNRGTTISNLAHFMLSLGCKYALNLGGGHSSTMYYDGRTFHCQESMGDDELSDKHCGEKPVGNVLIFVKR